MAEGSTPIVTGVPVAGGVLRVSQWGAPRAPALLCLHGVTGNSMVWSKLARLLSDDYHLIAPDLRGRGLSADVAGPWGMAEHVADAIAVLDRLAVDRVCLVGHSMGGFLAVLIANARPDRVSDVLLVDGGLPAIEANQGDEPLTEMLMQTYEAELRFRFSDRDEYLSFCRDRHEAGVEWDEDAVSVALRGVASDGTGLKLAYRLDALAGDSSHLAGSAAGDALGMMLTPALLLRAPEALPPRDGPLYTEAEVAHWVGAVPALEARDVPGTNHASIMSSPEGLTAIRAGLARLEDRRVPDESEVAEVVEFLSVAGADAEGTPDRRVAKIHAENPTARGAGIELEHVEHGRVALAMIVRPEMANAHGIAHGGWLFTLADTAFAYAAESVSKVAFTTSALMTFHTPGRVGDRLIATAREGFRDGRAHMFDVVIADETGRRIASARIQGVVPWNLWTTGNGEANGRAGASVDDHASPPGNPLAQSTTDDDQP